MVLLCISYWKHACLDRGTFYLFLKSIYCPDFHYLLLQKGSRLSFLASPFRVPYYTARSTSDLLHGARATSLIVLFSTSSPNAYGQVTIMQQNNCRDVFTLDLVDNIDAPPIDFYASIQARLKRVGEEASTYAQSLWGKSVSNFLDSTPGTEEMDDSWQPVRMLGKGSFGIVGLWQKIGRKGEIEDDVAIKEMEHPRHDDLCLQRDRRLPKEAVIMQQLNDAERRQDWSTNYILRLRSFRNFPAAGRWRFYLENGQYGDLYKLLHSYRAWDSYFPEEFLWHVFNDLAKAAVVMHEGPFTHLESGKPSDWSITHFDIKPENIYLGKRDKDATFANYPTMKLADFGLAEMTGEDDRNNPYEYRPKGTDDFKPPVSNCSHLLSSRRVTY